MLRPSFASWCLFFLSKVHDDALHHVSGLVYFVSYSQAPEQHSLSLDSRLVSLAFLKNLVLCAAFFVSSFTVVSNDSDTAFVTHSDSFFWFFSCFEDLFLCRSIFVLAWNRNSYLYATFKSRCRDSFWFELYILPVFYRDVLQDFGLFSSWRNLLL